MWIKDKILNIGGAIIGYAEKYLGFRYPVREYKEKVSDDLWRGSRVDAEGIRILAKQGIQTIVNLCSEMKDNEEVARECCIRTVQIPIMDNQAPQQEQMETFLSLFSDKHNCPIYVHCEAGMGRTGVAVACYRIGIQEWTAENAIKDGTRHKLCIPNQLDFIRNFKWNKKL